MKRSLAQCWLRSNLFTKDWTTNTKADIPIRAELNPGCQHSHILATRIWWSKRLCIHWLLCLKLLARGAISLNHLAFIFITCLTVNFLSSHKKNPVFVCHEQLSRHGLFKSSTKNKRGKRFSYRTCGRSGKPGHTLRNKQCTEANGCTICGSRTHGKIMYISLQQHR